MTKIKVTHLASGGVQLTPDVINPHPQHFVRLRSWPCTEVELARALGMFVTPEFNQACWTALDMATTDRACFAKVEVIS